MRILLKARLPGRGQGALSQPKSGAGQAADEEGSSGVRLRRSYHRGRRSGRLACRPAGRRMRMLFSCFDLSFGRKGFELQRGTIGVVVPAFNEELLIGETLRSIPDYVDRVYVVDDCSHDKTAEIVKDYEKKDSRVECISHRVNKGVGAAIITGTRRRWRMESILRR